MNEAEALSQHVKIHSLSDFDYRIDINRLILTAQDAPKYHETALNVQNLPFTDPNDNLATPSSALADDRQFACTIANCDRTFTRSGDLERHMRKHQPGSTQFHCWESGCNRNGVNGFYRRDKLASHQKRHRG